MIHFLYYPYVGICSRHPHITLNKANGLVATAPFTSNWPCPSPLVNVPNWVDDIYLKRRGADASIGSRFAESEPYAWPVSSFCRCGPAALWFSNVQFPMSPPLHLHPSGTKNFIYFIDSASSIQQTAPYLPNQGWRAFPWCMIWSNLCPPYKVQLLLFFCWTFTHPSYYCTLTTHITVCLKT
jgi:hypothetical protein